MSVYLEEFKAILDPFKKKMKMLFFLRSLSHSIGSSPRVNTCLSTSRGSATGGDAGIVLTGGDACSNSAPCRTGCFRPNYLVTKGNPVN